MDNLAILHGLKVESLTFAGNDISAIVASGGALVEKKYLPSQLPPKLVFEVGDRLVELRVLSRKADGSRQNGAGWSADKDARRCALIDKKIQRTIDAVELEELEGLQAEAMEYFDQIAPPPIEGARRLHERLLAMSRSRSET